MKPFDYLSSYARVCSRAVLLSAFGALLLTHTPAQAQDDMFAIDFSPSIAATTDYVFRGISQTAGLPAVQGSLDLGMPNLILAPSVGAWISNVTLSEDAGTEIDIYAGLGYTLGDITVSAAFTYFVYPGVPEEDKYNFYEVSGGVDWAVPSANLSFSVAYSPDTFGGAGEALYYRGGVEVELPIDGLSLGGHVGYQQIEDNDGFGLPDYVEWGLGFYFAPGNASFAVEYMDTTVTLGACGSPNCEPRVVFSGGYSF